LLWSMARVRTIGQGHRANSLGAAKNSSNIQHTTVDISEVA
jgi:hypothetical protein